MPSGRMATARRTPSLMTVSKMPGRGGLNRKVDRGRTAADIDGDRYTAGERRFAGNLEGELFHAADVADTING